MVVPDASLRARHRLTVRRLRVGFNAASAVASPRQSN
jgi:hypothetical protein